MPYTATLFGSNTRTPTLELSMFVKKQNIDRRPKRVLQNSRDDI